MRRRILQRPLACPKQSSRQRAARSPAFQKGRRGRRPSLRLRAQHLFLTCPPSKALSRLSRPEGSKSRSSTHLKQTQLRPIELRAELRSVDIFLCEESARSIEVGVGKAR